MSEIDDLIKQAEASAEHIARDEYGINKTRFSILDGYSKIAYKPLEYYVIHFYDLFISESGGTLNEVLDGAFVEVMDGDLGPDPKSYRDLDLKHDDYMYFLRQFKNFLSFEYFYDTQIDRERLEKICLVFRQTSSPFPFVDFLLPFVGAVIAFHKFNLYLKVVASEYDKYHKIPKNKDFHDYGLYESLLEPDFYQFDCSPKSVIFARRMLHRYQHASMTELVGIVEEHLKTE